jgi:hypothetical protein
MSSKGAPAMKHPTTEAYEAAMLENARKESDAEKCLDALLHAEKCLEAYKRSRPNFAGDRGEWSECLDTLILMVGLVAVLVVIVAVAAAAIHTT